MSKKLILCDCLGTQQIDAERISEATGVACSGIHNHLCGRQSELAAKALSDGDAMIACGQEGPRFEELAAELAAETPSFVDLRDHSPIAGAFERIETGPMLWKIR